MDGVARWNGVIPAGQTGVTVTWTGRVIAPPSGPLAALLQAEGGLPQRSNAITLSIDGKRNVYLPFVRR